MSINTEWRDKQQTPSFFPLTGKCAAQSQIEEINHIVELQCSPAVNITHESQLQAWETQVHFHKTDDASDKTCNSNDCFVARNLYKHCGKKSPSVLDQWLQMESSWDKALKDQSPETWSQFTDGKVDPFCQTGSWELEPKPRKTIQLSPCLSSGYTGEFSCQSKPWHTLNEPLKREMF